MSSHHPENETGDDRGSTSGSSDVEDTESGVVQSTSHEDLADRVYYWMGRIAGGLPGREETQDTNGGTRLIILYPDL